MGKTTAQFYLENRKSPPSCLGFFLACASGQPVIKIWYIKRSLQVEMCFPLGGQASRSKFSIGSGSSYAIYVFYLIALEVSLQRRALCARVSVLDCRLLLGVPVECRGPSTAGGLSASILASVLEFVDLLNVHLSPSLFWDFISSIC